MNIALNTGQLNPCLSIINVLTVYRYGQFDSFGYFEAKMNKHPELVSSIFNWYTEHKHESSYAFVAALMAVLRSLYIGELSWWRRCIDAAICAILAFFILDILTLMDSDPELAHISSVFIGFLGVDYFNVLIRKLIGHKTNSEKI